MIVDDQSDPVSYCSKYVAMVTNFGGLNRQNCHTGPLFSILAFTNRLKECYIAVCVNNGNDPSTLCRNLVSFHAVLNSRFKRLHYIQQVLLGGSTAVISTRFCFTSIH